MLRHRGYKTYHRPKKTNNWKNFFAWLKIGRGRKWNLPRDVSGKMFHNPYLNKKHLPTRTKAPRIKITIGIISLLTIIGILTLHPYFNIKRVSIAGLERISYNELNNLTNRILDAKRLWFFNGRNYFIANTNKIEKEIKTTYALEDLKIKSSFPNKIEISVKEKRAKLLLENSLAQLNGEPKNHYYLIDGEGKIIQEVDAADINSAAYLNLLMLKTQEMENLTINESAVAPAAVQFLLFLQEKIPAKTNVNISFVELNKDGGVVNLTTTEGWRIITDRQNDWEKQIQVLTIFLRDKIKDKRNNLNYIDVRYENRSYYQ
ncbi:MAG: FtsQ-type POTRA domain-containing protein [Candidatus Magasanikbacteria bacterium]|nr:FtsQ-type POTRA domain-containing protein [Candidatus Magasanikbacteria bacterium]